MKGEILKAAIDRDLILNVLKDNPVVYLVEELKIVEYRVWRVDIGFEKERSDHYYSSSKWHDIANTSTVILRLSDGRRHTNRREPRNVFFYRDEAVAELKRQCNDAITEATP